jgi:sugar phosphate isomerase/epimerase
MRLSVSSYSFEAIPLEGTLAIARSMGFKAVDIAGFHNRGRASYEPDEVGANPQKFADELKALLDKYELEAMDFFPQFGSNPGERSINDPDPAIRQQDLQSFRGIVQFCKLVGMHTVTVLPGADHLGRSLEQNLDVSGAMLKQFTEIAGEQEITLCFEPHVGSVSPTPELAFAVLERTPGAKFTLDCSHYLLQYISMDRIYAMIPQTGNVHIRQARPGKLQTRFAEGTIDFVDMAKRLGASGYNGCLSLEYICADWYDLNQLDTLYETTVTMAALAPHVPL